jgi:hypothetical protein
MIAKEIIEKIIYLSMKLELMFFEKRHNNLKWILKLNSLEIIKNHQKLLHNNYCIRLKILHDTQQYESSISILNLLQSKLILLDEINKLIKNYFFLQKKYSKQTEENIIIESFSTNYV